VTRSVGEDQGALRAASMLRGWLAEEIIREPTLPSAIELITRHKTRGRRLTTRRFHNEIKGKVVAPREVFRPCSTA
jgi:hypothetical protein